MVIELMKHPVNRKAILQTKYTVIDYHYQWIMLYFFISPPFMWAICVRVMLLFSRKLDTCLWNTYPGSNKVNIWQNLKVLHFDLVPSEHEMSVKCEHPLDENTILVWWLYDNPNFKYCTLFVSKTVKYTNRQTDRRRNRRTEGRSDSYICLAYLSGRDINMQFISKCGYT